MTDEQIAAIFGWTGEVYGDRPSRLITRYRDKDLHIVYEGPLVALAPQAQIMKKLQDQEKGFASHMQNAALTKRGCYLQDSHDWQAFDAEAKYWEWVEKGSPRG